MQSLDSEKGLIKFSHCKKDIFCSYVPKLCPVCGQSLNYRRLEDAPVSIPCPFVNGHKQICSFLLKPTTGTFLSGLILQIEFHRGQWNHLHVQDLLIMVSQDQENSVNSMRVLLEWKLSTILRICLLNEGKEARIYAAVLLIKKFRGYDGSSDLHVGITNTNGLVYNYNENGIHRGEHGWEQCISIPLVQPDMYGLLKQWDKYLEEFSTGEAWVPHRYDENHHNCYTYALAFINCVLAAEGKQQMSKSEFTERFVIPQTRKASKYITLYQEVAENYFYIVDSPPHEKNTSEEDKSLP